MVRGRKPQFRNPITVSLVVEDHLHKPMQALRIKESYVYSRGAKEIIKERISELTEEHFDRIIQALRVDLQHIQEEIAWFERMRMDTRIKKESQDRQKKEIRYDDRGKEYQVVIAQ
jgi:DNA repair exonuclease SbcCD nuclease subunit